MCVAAGNAIWVSTDGGQTWNYRPAAGGYNELLDVSCFGGATCLAVGPIGSGAVGQVVISTDDGATWSSNVAVLPMGTGTAQVVSCVTGLCGIAGPSTIVNPVQPVPALFTASTNGGTTWSTPSGPTGFNSPSVPIGAPLIGVACSSSTTCVLAGMSTVAQFTQGASAEFSTNGGQTWTSSSVT
jgi:hypothetical protein